MTRALLIPAPDENWLAIDYALIVVAFYALGLCKLIARKWR